MYGDLRWAGFGELIEKLEKLRSLKSLGFISSKWHLLSWWRHQVETFSALLAICAGNSPVSGEFHAQRPVTRSFDVFFDVRLIQRLSKHSRGWWFETLLHPLWRHRNVGPMNFVTVQYAIKVLHVRHRDDCGMLWRQTDCDYDDIHL